MEASALHTPASPIRPRLSLAPPLLRLRSDEQLVTLFRDGHDEAFRVIHDRYHRRLAAYTRQMLPGAQDAEDAVQDVFVRVYTNLRGSGRGVSHLRPWLYRTAHNRCIDELRRPAPPPPEVLAEVRSSMPDPIAQVVERESLHRVVEHIKRLPAQQRSALLLRELDGASYADIATALETTVPAVKSLLVRARLSLVSSLEACDTPCATIREELTIAHDRGVRPPGTARAHLHDCVGCRAFRQELRGTSRQLAALAPALGPLGVVAKALGFGGAGGGASAGGGAAVAGGGGAVAAASFGGGHLATLIAAAVVTAGGAIEIQNAVSPHGASSGRHPAVVSGPPATTSGPSPSVAAPAPTPHGGGTPATPAQRPSTPVPAAAPARIISTGSSATVPTPPRPADAHPTTPMSITQPSTTGIGSVSKPSAASNSAIGYTSITGIGDVSALKPKTQSSGDGGTTTTSTTASGTDSGAGASTPDGGSGSTVSQSSTQTPGSTQSAG